MGFFIYKIFLQANTGHCKQNIQGLVVAYAKVSALLI